MQPTGTLSGVAMPAIVAVFAVACNGAETRDDSPQMQPAPEARLVIETERPVIALGEPAYVTVRLINQGTSALRLIPLLRPADGYLAVSVVGPGGEPAGFVPLSVRDSDVGPSELAPGAELATTFPIFFGAAGWTMPTPGDYRLLATFTLHDGTGRPREARSDSLVIRVAEGPAELGRALMSGDAASIEAGKFLLWSGGDQLVEGQRLLAQLAGQHANTPFASHYHVAAGRSFARPFRDYRQNAVRPPDHARAVAELERAQDDAIPAYVRVQKYLTLAASYDALGRTADAARAVEAARALIASRPELQEFREQLERVR